MPETPPCLAAALCAAVCQSRQRRREIMENEAIAPGAQIGPRLQQRPSKRGERPAEQAEERRERGQTQPRRRKQQARSDGEERARRDQAAAQAVEEAKSIHWPEAPLSQPREVLPVAARPALEPGIKAQGLCRKAVDDLDVREITPAQERALDRIVAQDAVFGEVGGAEEQRVNIENPLACEATAVIAILKDLAAGAAIGVRAAGAGKEAGKVRGRGVGEIGRNARVQKAIPRCDALLFPVELRAIQRMEHGRNQLARGTRREHGVRVEREEKTHVPERGFVPEVAQVGTPAAQERREAQERAALALPSAPDAVRLREGARAREEGKAAAEFLVQAPNPCLRRAENGLVRGVMLAAALPKIGEDAEREVLARVAAAEAEFLEPRSEVLRLLRRGEQRRDDAERAPRLRHAVFERHARDAARLRKAPQNRVLQLLDEFRDRQEQQRGADRTVRERADENGDGSRQEPKAGDINSPVRPRRLGLPERKADVARLPRGAVRLLEERLGVVALGDAAPSRLPRDPGAVFRAAGAVHLRINACRVAAEQAVERVRPLEQFAEIERGERAQGGEMRADGLVRRIVRAENRLERADDRRLHGGQEERVLRVRERQGALKAREPRLNGLLCERAAAGIHQLITAAEHDRAILASAQVLRP